MDRPKPSPEYLAYMRRRWGTPTPTRTWVRPAPVAPHKAPTSLRARLARSR